MWSNVSKESLATSSTTLDKWYAVIYLFIYLFIFLNNIYTVI